MNHIFHKPDQIAKADIKPGDTVHYHHPEFGIMHYPVVDDEGETVLKVFLDAEFYYFLEPRHFESAIV